MIRLQSRANCPTQFGNFIVSAYAEDATDLLPIMVLSTESALEGLKSPLIRLHSECITGDVFHSLRCDCGAQLQEALKMIHAEGGHLLYLRQEGRGIGIINKLKAYELQDQGMNTLEANLHLGFRGDEREYFSAVQVLKLLDIHSLRLITNNPDKITYLQNHDITVQERVPLIIPPVDENRSYLDTKRDKMGHLI